MRILKRNPSERPRVTLVLLDWSVRESFHLLHYLKKQTVPREAFEVQVIEYYSTISGALRTFEEEVDTWVLLEMPEDCYYHKHLMYNVGVVLARGDLIVICDSDAMVRETFVESILAEFDRNEDLVLHLDQFRNIRRDFYPFNYPSFEDVLGEGCINRAGEVTTGLADEADTIHTRNYGACFCARRDQLIAVGGADEHVDFLGHVCGPYDLTFRLTNHGCRLEWHEKEFMYHTWHPGSDGVGNYMGPHDGMNMSTTAFEALLSRRVLPHRENRAVQALREGAELDDQALLGLLIDPSYPSEWRIERLDQLYAGRRSERERPVGRGFLYRGFHVVWSGEAYEAVPLVVEQGRGVGQPQLAAEVLNDVDRAGIQRKIDARIRSTSRVALLLYALVAVRAELRDVLAAVRKKGMQLLRRALRETAGSVRSASARLREVVERARSLVSRRHGPAGGFTDAFFGAYLVSQRIEKDETALLLVGPLRSPRYFALLRRLGVLRGLRVRAVSDSESLKAALRSFEESGSKGSLLIDADLYLRQYSAVAGDPRIHRAWIV